VGEIGQNIYPVILSANKNQGRTRGKLFSPLEDIVQLGLKSNIYIKYVDVSRTDMIINSF
jgi:hypothetical protein